MTFRSCAKLQVPRHPFVILQLIRGCCNMNGCQKLDQSVASSVKVTDSVGVTRLKSLQSNLVKDARVTEARGRATLVAVRIAQRSVIARRMKTEPRAWKNSSLVLNCNVYRGQIAEIRSAALRVLNSNGNNPSGQTRVHPFRLQTPVAQIT